MNVFNQNPNNIKLEWILLALLVVAAIVSGMVLWDIITGFNPTFP